MSQGKNLTSGILLECAGVERGRAEEEEKKLRDDLVMLKCSRTKTEIQHVTPCSQTFK